MPSAEVIDYFLALIESLLPVLKLLILTANMTQECFRGHVRYHPAFIIPSEAGKALRMIVVLCGRYFAMVAFLTSKEFSCILLPKYKLSRAALQQITELYLKIFPESEYSLSADLKLGASERDVPQRPLQDVFQWAYKFKQAKAWHIRP
jgi:hypothetical protein